MLSNTLTILTIVLEFVGASLLAVPMIMSDLELKERLRAALESSQSVKRLHDRLIQQGYSRESKITAPSIPQRYYVIQFAIQVTFLFIAINLTELPIWIIFATYSVFDIMFQYVYLSRIVHSDSSSRTYGFFVILFGMISFILIWIALPALLAYFIPSIFRILFIVYLVVISFLLLIYLVIWSATKRIHDADSAQTIQRSIGVWGLGFLFMGVVLQTFLSFNIS